MWQVSPTGELTVSQSVTSGGICPRHFVLDYAPAGDAWLRIANQDSQTIVSYLLGKNGEMTAPGDGLWQTVWASPATLELDGLCPSVITPPAPPPIWLFTRSLYRFDEAATIGFSIVTARMPSISATMIGAARLRSADRPVARFARGDAR